MGGAAKKFRIIPECHKDAVSVQIAPFEVLVFYIWFVQSRIKINSTHCIWWIWLLCFFSFKILLFLFFSWSLFVEFICPIEFTTVWLLLLANWCSSVVFIFLLDTVRSRGLIKFRFTILVETLRRWWCVLLIASHQETQNQFHSGGVEINLRVQVLSPEHLTPIEPF